MWTGGIPGSLNKIRVTGALHTEAERCRQPVSSKAALLAALREGPSIHGHHTSPCGSEAPRLVSATEKVTCDAQQLTASTPCLSRHVSGCGAGVGVADRKPRGWDGSGEVDTLNAPAWLTPFPKTETQAAPSSHLGPVWEPMARPCVSLCEQDRHPVESGSQGVQCPLYRLSLLPKQELGRHWPLESHVPSSPRNYSPPGPWVSQGQELSSCVFQVSSRSKG